MCPCMCDHVRDILEKSKEDPYGKGWARKNHCLPLAGNNLKSQQWKEDVDLWQLLAWAGHQSKEAAVDYWFLDPRTSRDAWRTEQRNLSYY
jgi:hypothetical protein